MVAAFLRDLAEVQTSRESKWGYTGAAAAIMSLDQPLETLVRGDGTLEKIPRVGPSSMRVALEVLQTGESPTVERAVAASGRAAEVQRRRALRTHFLSRARVVEVLADRRLRGPRVGEYQGDLQMHSVWSDGAQPIADLVQACLARGYRYCAVTDHSHGLPIAGGLSADAMRCQHREIAALNQRHAGRFRVLRAIEANISSDGSLDTTRAELRRLELVVAAPHSKLRGAEDQTLRMLTAVATPGVHVLGHPRGRMFGSRAGVVADWDEVFRLAARLGVAIEIDGDPWRQDIDFALARRAARAGCLFALDSDAHSTRELVYAETAIAHARLAGIARARVINTWDVERLLEWAAKAWTR